MPGVTLDSLPRELRELDGWLRSGKPELGWRGDARLELHVGVIEASNTGTFRGKQYRKGDVVGYRIEVHRHNEDGTDTPIIQRPVAQWHEIIPELVKIDPRNPMFKDTHTEVVKHNDALERERGRAIAEAKGEAIEHLWSLVADRQNGRTTFRGLPGRNPEKQL